MTEQEDEIRLKELLSVFGKERYRELINILDRDQKRYHKEQLILSGVVSTLPKKFSAAAYTQAITGNYEEFVKLWDER